jgi:uncharacterized protein (DUF111 family)
MAIDRIGYGAGQKDFPQANLLRLLVGQSTSAKATDSIVLLETNLDDATGEAIAYCAEQLAKAGALDVATTPLAMKKGRPGVLLAVQCRPADANALAMIVFRETTALGLRRSTVQRVTLPRKAVTVETAFGDVAGVLATLPDGTTRFSPEYEACACIAAVKNVPLADIQAAASLAFKR